MSTSRRSTTTRRTVAGGLAAVVGTMALLAGCSNHDDSGPVSAGDPQVTSTTVAPSTSTTSAAGTGTTSGPGPTGNLPFVADTRPDVSTERVGLPLLVSVTEGSHEGYVRYVFRFTNRDPDAHQSVTFEARPPWDVRWVPDDEVVQDGSGNPVPVGGAAHLRILFKANMHHDDGTSSLESSVRDDGDLAFASDFEGHVVWFYGADKEEPFRVEYVGEGRVAVDIAR